MSSYTNNLYKTTLEFSELLVLLILQQSGMIFGGYVRDRILREHCILEFNKIISIDDPEYNTKFYNCCILPELSDRILTSTDIDCLLTKKSMGNILHELRYVHNFTIRKVFKRSPCKYIPSFKHISANAYTHYRYKISSYNRNIINQLKYMGIDEATINSVKSQNNYVNIVLDFIVSNDGQLPSDPFLVPIDFECNGFYLKNSVNMPLLSRQVCNIPKSSISNYYKRVSEVYNSIYNQEAVCVMPDNVRIRKMIAKGFKIKKFPIMLPFKKNEDKYDDVCIICLSELDIEHLKTVCCNLHIHTNCYNDLFNNDNTCKVKCPVCK
jgi:hypothetical protein